MNGTGTIDGRAKQSQQHTTKENRKGSSQGYHRRRKLTLAIFLVAISPLLSWKFWSYRTSLPHQEGTVGTLADHPIHSVELGVKSTPMVMIRSSLDEDLHARFLKEYLYSCAEEELNQISELDNRVNPPVYVYEGYYHGLKTGEAVYSKNPNPYKGYDFDKPAASQFTRAFYVALRHVNREIFYILQQKLMAASSYNSTKQEDACYLFATWIEKGKHFADLSIQIHYGRGNDDKLRSGAAWHTDAENSLLHFAVTLRGERVLHSKRIRDISILGERKKPTEVIEKQTPGNVYLSSSTLMLHAPQFFDTDYDSRVIAIHARILYTNAEIDHFRSVRTHGSWEKLTSALAATLSRARLQMPTLEQVEFHMRHLT